MYPKPKSPESLDATFKKRQSQQKMLLQAVINFIPQTEVEHL